MPNISHRRPEVNTHVENTLPGNSEILTKGLKRIKPRVRQLTAIDAADLYRELEDALYGLDVLRSAIKGQLDMDLPEILQMADDLTLDAANALDRALHYIASAVKVEVRS